jgi:hypothetical protein
VQLVEKFRLLRSKPHRPPPIRATLKVILIPLIPTAASIPPRVASSSSSSHTALEIAVRVVTLSSCDTATQHPAPSLAQKHPASNSPSPRARLWYTWGRPGTALTAARRAFLPGYVLADLPICRFADLHICRFADATNPTPRLPSLRPGPAVRLGGPRGRRCLGSWPGTGLCRRSLAHSTMHCSMSSYRRSTTAIRSLTSSIH